MTNEEQVYNTLKQMVEERKAKRLYPLFVSGVELKRKFDFPINNILYSLYKKGLIERREGLNNYLITIKDSKYE